MSVSKSLLYKPQLAALAAVVAGALAGPANAQQQDVNRENANRPAVVQPRGEQPTQIARSDTGMQTLEQYLQTKAVRVSKLLGMEVQNRSGDNLGEVHEVLASTAPGRDHQLVVSLSGSGAEKLIAMPFDEIQIAADGDELYTTRTRDQLAASPAVALDARAGAAQTGTPSRDQRIGDLVGAQLIGNTGDKVGEVDDIVISTAGADSIRAVLQVGGLLGIGEKRVSLPLNDLEIERAPSDNEPTLRVAMDGDALQRIPEFEYEEQTTAL